MEQLEEIFHSVQHIVWKNSRLIPINFWTGDELHRMEKYRLKEKITNILYDQQ